ncbi:hypothetical protein GCM10009570_34000 [Dietzia natronolimnaea]
MACSTGSVGRPSSSSDWALAEAGTASDTAMAATAPRPRVLNEFLSEWRVTGESILRMRRTDRSAGRPIDGSMFSQRLQVWIPEVRLLWRLWPVWQKILVM